MVVGYLKRLKDIINNPDLDETYRYTTRVEIHGSNPRYGLIKKIHAFSIKNVSVTVETQYKHEDIPIDRILINSLDLNAILDKLPASAPTRVFVTSGLPYVFQITQEILRKGAKQELIHILDTHMEA